MQVLIGLLADALRISEQLCSTAERNRTDTRAAALSPKIPQTEFTYSSR